MTDCRERGITQHVALNERNRRSAIDARTYRHAGYRESRRIHKRIEECFGWAKDGRPLRKMKVYGKAGVEYATTLTLDVYTLMRMTRLLPPGELIGT